MEDKIFIKHIQRGSPLKLADMVDFEPGNVISVSLVQRPGLAMSLFAISQGEGIGGHASTGDALVNVLSGCAQITIGGQAHRVSAGESILMPAGINHDLHAIESFKMLLTVVKPD